MKGYIISVTRAEEPDKEPVRFFVDDADWPSLVEKVPFLKKITYPYEPNS